MKGMTLKYSLLYFIQFIEANKSPHEFVLQIMERIQTEISRLLTSIESIDKVPDARTKIVHVLKIYAGSLEDAAPGSHVVVAKHLRQTALALKAEVNELTTIQDSSFPNRLR